MRPCISKRRALRCVVDSLELRRLLTFGQLEPLFGGGDGKLTSNFGTTEAGAVVLEQPDGKILVAGSNFIGSSPDFSVVRYLPNGVIDTAFGSSGIASTTFGSTDLVTGAALQSDGKIILVGSTTVTPSQDYAVARFNADGTIDNTFDGDGKLTIDVAGTDSAAAVAVQSDDKIVIAGTSFIGSSDDFSMVRLNANGTLDNTFSSDGKETYTFGFVDVATSLVIDQLGRYVAAGYTNAASSGTNNDIAVIRVSSSGSLDASFNSDGRATIDFGFDDRAQGVTVDRAGRIVVAGADDGGAADFAVARLTDSGDLDTNFNDVATPSIFNGDGKLSFTFAGTVGAGGIDFGRSVAVTDGNAIFVGGYTNANLAETGVVAGDFNFAVAKITESGTLDPTFDGNGKKVFDMGSTVDQANSIAFTRDHSLLVAGTVAGDFALARLRGALDVSFGQAGATTLDLGALEDLQAVAVQPDGKYVVAGKWDGGASEFLIARYNADGTLDPTFDNTLDVLGAGTVNVTFGAGFFGGADFATDLVLQPDGKIIVVGYTNQVDGVPAAGGNDMAICRLNPNGSLDTTFSGDGKVTVNFGSDDRANAVALQKDGKIVIAGSWDGGLSDFAVVRLNPNGALDTSFSGDGLANMSFSSGFGGIEVANDVAILPSGRIVLVGVTDQVNDVAALGGTDAAIAVFEPNGTLSTTFSGDGRATYNNNNAEAFKSVVVTPNGKILAGGSDFIGNSADFLFAQFNADGNPDVSFGAAGIANYLLGSEDLLNDLAIQPDGKIVGVGQSTFPDNSSTRSLAIRLLPNGSIDTSFQPMDEGGFDTYEFRYKYPNGASAIQAVAVTPNGGLVYAGSAGTEAALAVSHPGSNQATSAEYLFDGSPLGFTSKPATRVWFSNGVNLSTLATADFVLTNTTTASIIPAGQLTLNFSVGGNAVDIRFTGTSPTGVNVLPDGNYTLAFTAGTFSDSAGNLNTSTSFSFFVLSGDVNRDRAVNFDDLLIVAQNYGNNGRRFSQGNLNYTADGSVNFDDLLLIAQRYGTSLFSNTPVQPMPSIALGGRRRSPVEGLLA